MKKNILILLLMLPVCAGANLLDDITAGKWRAAAPQRYVPMPDGEKYARLEDSCVIAYSYQTGHITDTLLNIGRTKGEKPKNIEGFILSSRDRFMLLYNDREQIFRRSFKAHYYVYDKLRNEIKPLSEGKVQSPVISPDGRYVAFAKDNNLYLHKLDFGTEVAVTTDGSVGKIINGIPDWLYEEEFSTTCLFSFSPDSKQLAFVSLDETDVPQFNWLTYIEGGYPKEHSLKYPRAGEKNAVPKVKVYDTYYKSIKTMNIGDDDDIYIPRICWTQQEQFSLLAFRLNRNQNKLEVLSINYKTALSQLMYQEQNADGWIDFGCIDDWQLLSDGSFIVVNETDGYRHVWLYGADGLKRKCLTEGNFDVTTVYGYDELTKTLYYQAAAVNPMQREVYAYNVKKNKSVRLTPLDGFHSAVFSNNLNWFVDNYSAIGKPNTYILYNNQGKKQREWFDNNSLEQEWKKLDLPCPQFIKITTERGDELNGWILLPKDFDESKKYPVLQVQYSGPESQQVLNRWRIDWEYFLASQGVITVCVDGRGTGCRGTKFRQAAYMQLGVVETEDQISVAHYMQSLPYVDADRIGIWGWSYGGFMVLRCMAQPDSPFCCGISVAPVADFRLYDSAYTERFMRRPQANESGYKSADVKAIAEKLKGRLLLVHGVADDNVHCQQSWIYVDALVRANKQFDMQFYPDDNHFLKKRNNYKHLYNRKWEFLQTNLLKNK